MNIAFIPVRGGSKSIPLKNIKILAGHPLVYWTATAANNAKCIDKVVIATDNAVSSSASGVDTYYYVVVEYVNQTESSEESASQNSEFGAQLKGEISVKLAA